MPPTTPAALLQEEERICGVRSARRRRSIKMRRISVEVSSGTARFRVSIQAKTIERALELAHRQNSGKEYKIIFPMDPQAFSVREESVARVGALGMAEAA
jgi:hypothetical protein